MKKTVLASLIALAVIILAACGAGANACSKCEVTDIITNTETRNNGAMIIWVRTDTTSAYCTHDIKTFELAQELREKVQYATIQYATINTGDSDSQQLIGGAGPQGGCDPEMTGVRVYRLIALRKAGYEAQ